MFVCPSDGSGQVLQTDPTNPTPILRVPPESSIHQEDLRLIDLRLREDSDSPRPLNLNGGEDDRDSVGVVLDIDFTGDGTEEGRPELNHPPEPPVDCLLSVHHSTI